LSLRITGPLGAAQELLGDIRFLVHKMCPLNIKSVPVYMLGKLEKFLDMLQGKY
jgi:hypothetical protein